MSVGLLIITHGGIGKSLMETATGVLGVCPLQTEVMSIAQDCEPQVQLRRARDLIEKLDQGAGVLVLTDMYGSTPGNIAGALQSQSVVVIAGVNLPMLVRLLNYPQLGLQDLANKAISGGCDGVLIYTGREG